MCVFVSLTSNDMWDTSDMKFLLRTFNSTVWVLHLHHNGLQLEADRQQPGVIYIQMTNIENKEVHSSFTSSPVTVFRFGVFYIFK